MSTNFLFSKVCLSCFAFTPQANFPAHDLNFHWMWRYFPLYEIVDLKPPNRNACANSLQALLLHLSQMIGMAGAILPSKAQASQPTRSTLFCIALIKVFEKLFFRKELVWITAILSDFNIEYFNSILWACFLWVDNEFE